MGNAYFTGADVDILKKMKELYSQAEMTQKQLEQNNILNNENNNEISNPNQKINFLTKAKNRVKTYTSQDISFGIQGSLKKLENSLIGKISDILSEKMDGFDEIIVELIRSKTENENLRQQVNDLNKQVFILRKELASYIPLPFGFYTKKDTEDL